jgi:hypothetical protein
MARTTTHGDLFGKGVAALVFLIGIAALVTVFVNAVGLFQAPVAGLGLPLAKGQAPPAALNLGVALIQLLYKLLVLIVMTVAGSLIASKGIHLYQAASMSHHPAAALPTEAETTVPAGSTPPAT